MLLDSFALSVAAVVVSYRDVDAVRRAATALRAQVGTVIIVDNGSASTELEGLRHVASDVGAELIELDRNCGIGVALNTGVARARERRAKWVLTMDQDSVIGPGFVAQMGMVACSARGPLSLTPVFDRVPQAPGTQVRSVAYAITSGNMLSMELIDAVGQFDHGMFIDGVDFDYSLRIRRRGYTILQVCAATMTHRLGERATGIAFHTVHSPTRRYYMSRNLIVLVRRYIAAFPGFIAKLLVSHLLSSGLALLLGPKRRQSARGMVLGLRDGMRGVQGSFQLC